MSDEIKSAEQAVVAPEAAEAPAAPSMDDIVRDPNAPIMTMKKLLEAGVHFGHQTRRWNPKMARYIYGARNGIYIIDLGKTVDCVNVAYAALREIVDKGGKILFVGTKPAAKQIVLDNATRSGSFYINNRWLGGTLTNFRTILNRIKRLKELEAMSIDGSFDKLPKKEVAVLRKEMDKLSKNLEGLKEMRRLPQAIILDDPTVEHNAVLEAKKLGISIFAVCDTSDDPDVVDYPIPSNNDAGASLKLILGVLADAIVESKGGITAIAHVPDEGEEATMKDAIRVADAANEQRKAAIRQQRREREERYRKLQAERAARFAARKGEKPASEKPAEAAAPEAPAAEEKKEA